jgi:Cd2+/Zn2+-exporting ATPase/Cu+-exporting ATPase
LDGIEAEIPIKSVKIGDLVVIRPGESIPVDGEVVVGHAAVDQSAITGESMPVDVGPGNHVYAATIAHGGSIQVNAIHVGRESTIGRIIKMVEEAEANRADVQRFADKFSTYFLPIVLIIAILTLLIRRDPMAVAAVLVVACSCAIALATPIAMLASIGSGAKKGLMIKGGKYVELLDKAHILLIDKTGTLTLGKPRVTDIVTFNGLKESQLLSMAASVEKYSEHPIAGAVQEEARKRGLNLHEPAHFKAIPGFGVKAEVAGRRVRIGNERMIDASGLMMIGDLKEQGKTLLFIEVNGQVAGLLAVADELRDEVPDALAEVRKLGVSRIELLSGDHEQATAAIADRLKLPYQANLLPEDKITIVKSYQRQGHRVVMIGDGINDAPALAQADVGIAMGAAGTDVALEAAHVALMRDDWRLVPDLFRISHRTMRVVRMNLGFTAVYNVIGLTLAAFGILPPVLAAAAQSLPDLGILANSSRLLRD